MFEMLEPLRSLAQDRRGATAIEYTLIAALIALAAIVAMGAIGSKITNVMNTIGNTI